MKILVSGLARDQFSVITVAPRVRGGLKEGGWFVTSQWGWSRVQPAGPPPWPWHRSRRHPDHWAASSFLDPTVILLPDPCGTVCHALA